MVLLNGGQLDQVSRDQTIARDGYVPGETSARQAGTDLLRDALEGGGTDNTTIIIGRAMRTG